MRRCVSRITFVLLVCSAAAASAQSVDEVVAKNLEAKGGAAKWKAVSSVKMSGRLSAQGQELPLVVYAKRPNQTRQEISFEDKRMIQAFDGTTGWMINPMIGSNTPQPTPPQVSEMMKNTADFDGPLQDYKTKGHAIELAGKQKLDDKEVYHLKVTLKGGKVQDYYIDAGSGVEVKKSEEVEMGPGAKQTLETEMSNYKPVDGILVAHTIRQSISGKPVAEITIDKVEFNSPVDDELFRMPKK